MNVTLSMLYKVRQVLGTRGIICLILCICASVALAAVEFGIAGFLQLFLVSLGYVDPLTLPGWLRSFTGVPIVALCAILVLIGLLRAMAMFLSVYSNDLVQQQMNLRFRLTTIYEMLMIAGRQFLPASEVHHRMGELFPVARHFVFAAINIVITVTQILLILIGMVLITWKESIVGFLGLGITALFVVTSNKVVARHSIEVPVVQMAISKGIERVSRNWLFVRISRTQSSEYGKLVGKVGDYYHFVTRASLFTTVMLGLPPLFGIMLFAIIILLSRTWFNTNPASLVVFLYLYLRLVQQLGNCAQHFGQVTSSLPHFKEANRLFFSLTDGEMDQALKPATAIVRHHAAALKLTHNTAVSNSCEIDRPLTQPPPSLEIIDLGFAWAPGEPLLFKHFNLSLPIGGDILGVVGPSGSGKSTLMLLILGILKPNHGTVLIDGESPESYFEKHSLQVGYVGAEPFLIEGSLRHNLTYGLPFPVSDEEISNAIARSQLTAAVAGLGNGLDYILDENGSGLSSGQKQRLALARALLRNPVFLVLDEASANLDVETELDIAHTVKALQGSCTVLIVSHRPGILAAASKIISLENNSLGNPSRC